MSGRRTGWVVAAGLVLAVLTSVWVEGRGEEFGGRLDPQNPGPDGGQALAQVLADQGVDVEVVRSAAELEGVALRGATVVVTSTEQLGASTAGRLLRASGGTPTIVVEPAGEVADVLGQGAAPLPAAGARVAAQCADPRLNDLEIEASQALGYPAGTRGCFPARAGSASGATEDLTLWAPQDDGIAFLGFGDAWTNDGIVAADHAATGLRLLGGTPRLVWYVPDLADLSAGDEVGIVGLLPAWLVPALWLLGLVLVALVLWRVRRLGPLVSEPLPVAVKAIETTQSRARLYRKAQDRAHAASALRGAARSRAAQRLRLPRRHAEDVLLRDVARRSGLDLAEVEALLSSRAAPPVSDGDLTGLAARLADLDDTLRKAPR